MRARNAAEESLSDVTTATPSTTASLMFFVGARYIVPGKLTWLPPHHPPRANRRLLWSVAAHRRRLPRVLLASPWEHQSPDWRFVFPCMPMPNCSATRLLPTNCHSERKVSR